MTAERYHAIKRCITNTYAAWTGRQSLRVHVSRVFAYQYVDDDIRGSHVCIVHFPEGEAAFDRLRLSKIDFAFEIQVGLITSLVGFEKMES